MFVWVGDRAVRLDGQRQGPELADGELARRASRRPPARARTEGRMLASGALKRTCRNGRPSATRNSSVTRNTGTGRSMTHCASRHHAPCDAESVGSDGRIARNGASPTEPDRRRIDPRPEDGQRRRQQRQGRGDGQPHDHRTRDAHRPQHHEVEQQQPGQADEHRHAAEEDRAPGRRHGRRHRLDHDRLVDARPRDRARHRVAPAPPDSG